MDKEDIKTAKQVSGGLLLIVMLLLSMAIGFTLGWAWFFLFLAGTVMMCFFVLRTIIAEAEKKGQEAKGETK
jgi:hypothetical protein